MLQHNTGSSATAERPRRAMSAEILSTAAQLYEQVVQLSLTNPRDALIDIAYLCTKFDDIRFSRSSDMIGAQIFGNGSHDLTAPLSGTVQCMSSAGCDLHIQHVHQIFSLCDHKLRICIRQCKM